MNKASALGFAAGVVFLGLAVALFSIGNVQKGTQGGRKAAPAAGESRVPGADEPAESGDSAGKATARKMVDFKPAGSAALPKAQGKEAGLKLTRSATPGGYRTGQALDVFVSFAYDDKTRPSALALVERLPKGWAFEALTGGEKPAISPAKGAAGEMTFVWVQVPAFPCTVSYRIVPGPEVSGPQEIEGQAVYREAGPELRTEMVKTVVLAGGN
jgi:hypothetical protein